MDKRVGWKILQDYFLKTVLQIMLSLFVITSFLFNISCCRREEKKANLQNSHCTEYPLAKILSSHFFGKPSYSLYVWRKKFANHVLPSVVCVVVAIFVARGYRETNLQKSSSHPRLCEEGSLTAILHVTDYDSCVFLPAENFWQTPILECVCVGYFSVFVVDANLQKSTSPHLSLFLYEDGSLATILQIMLCV